MEPADGQVSGGLKLLWNGERLYALHVGTYSLLMVVPTLTTLLMSLLLFFMIPPDLRGKDLIEIVKRMRTLQKLGVIAMFFVSLAVFYRALAASILATSEFSERREIGAIQAFRRVRWKHTRLWWLMMVATFFGRLAIFVSLIAGFFFASAFPTAVVEDLGAFQALERGQKLAAGNQLRVATIYVTYLVALVGVVLAMVLGILKVNALIQNHFPSVRHKGHVLAFGGYLVFFSVVQWYMIVLTLNYLQQRRKLTESLTSSRDVAAGL